MKPPLTALAHGILLVAGLSLTAGPAAAQWGRTVGAESRASQAEVALAAPLEAGRVLLIGDRSQDPEEVALAREDMEDEGGGDWLEAEADEVVIEPRTSRRGPWCSGTLLVDGDAVALHAARGPPAD